MIERSFGVANELLNETRYLTPDPDGAGTQLPGAPLTTRYVYDTKQHLRFVVSAEGRITENRYNASGQLTATLQYLSGVYDLTGLSTTATLAETQLTTREQRELARAALREKKQEDAYALWAQEIRGRAYVEYREPPQ